MYNRLAHDKSVLVNVFQINFMIEIKNICIEESSKEVLNSYVNTDILNLMCSINLNDIRNFKEEDFKKICSYFPNTDKFFGKEYYILRHLIDYHLEEYNRDLKSNKLKEIIKLSVSKDNLIIKVFPSEIAASYNKKRRL